MYLKRLILKLKETDNVKFKFKHINSVEFALMKKTGEVIWRSWKTYPTKQIKVLARRFVQGGENCELTLFFWKEGRKISLTRKGGIIHIEGVL